MITWLKYALRVFLLLSQVRDAARILWASTPWIKWCRKRKKGKPR